MIESSHLNGFFCLRSLPKAPFSSQHAVKNKKATLLPKGSKAGVSIETKIKAMPAARVSGFFNKACRKNRASVFGCTVFVNIVYRISMASPKEKKRYFC